MTQATPTFPYARLAAFYADAAYEDEATFRDMVKPDPDDEIRLITVTGGALDVQAYVHVAEAAKLIVVAVRGTEVEKWDDWVKNLSFRAAKMFGGLGRAHRGFYDEATALRDELSKHLPCKPGYRIVLTGHSKGGSICTVLQHLTNIKATVHTFGECRSLGWRAAGLYDHYHRAHYRWVNTIDPVPKLLWWRYRHVGRLIYLDRKGNWNFGSVRFWDRFWVRVRNPFGAIARHSMTKYRQIVSRQSASTDI